MKGGWEGKLRNRKITSILNLIGEISEKEVGVEEEEKLLKEV